MGITKTHLTAKELEILTLDAEDKQKIMEIECHMRAHRGFEGFKSNRFVTLPFHDPIKEMEAAEEIHKNVTEVVNKNFPKISLLDRVNLFFAELFPWAYK